VEGKSIMAYKNFSGEVFHLPCTVYKGVPNFYSLCNRDISESSTVRQFEDIKNPNICRHCAIEFQRRGA
jgi:hypothetical protein